MPANHKVSVAWQIVFTFITGLNFWAFYRIRKLRKYLLYVILPSIVVLVWYISEIGWWFSPPAWATTNVPGDILSYREPWVVWLPQIVASAILWALQGFAIYLAVIWSRQHNKQLDT